MELVIHGTKGGYKANLFSTPNAPSSLGDIRKGASTENPLGQELYSIAYSNGVCIFTKYIILRDSLRSFATGTIAFSLYLSVNKELSGNGADIITLLDKLYVFYKNKYVKENNLNNGETNLIQEDWSFVTDILKEYKEQDKPNKQELLQSEDQEPAYIYYILM